MNLTKCKKICFDADFTRSQYIYKIITSGILDKQIQKIKYEKVQTSMYSTFKNGLTDSYNLFVLNLDKFLMFLELNFLLTNSERFVILTKMFESKYTDLFISTKDVNSERQWYMIQYKKLIIDKFLTNLKIIYNQNINTINKVIDRSFEINKISMSNIDDIDKVFNLLRGLINCNRNNSRFLFYDIKSALENNMYLDFIKTIFDNYTKKNKYLELLDL